MHANAGQTAGDMERVSQLDRVIQERTRQLNALTSEISTNEFILEKHKQKISKYKQKLESLKAELSCLQKLSPTH
jgi:predicted RNase H-like nuclease (RuvC/YqgF family)